MKLFAPLIAAISASEFRFCIQNLYLLNKKGLTNVLVKSLKRLTLLTQVGSRAKIFLKKSHKSIFRIVLDDGTIKITMSVNTLIMSFLKT